MAFLSIGCVVAADQRDDCILLRIDDGMFNNAFKTLTLKPSSKAAPRIGDCIVYTTDKEERRIVEFGIQNDLNKEIMTRLECLVADQFSRKNTGK